MLLFGSYSVWRQKASLGKIQQRDEKSHIRSWNAPPQHFTPIASAGAETTTQPMPSTIVCLPISWCTNPNQRLDKLRVQNVGLLCMLNVGFLYKWGVGMRQKKTLRERIERRIARHRNEDVFLTREFADLGGEDQVLRALRSLVRDNRLVRLGYGVYGRAIVSRLSGEPLLYSANGFIGAARQALNKLGVPWEPTEAERDYNEGRSTQVPVNPVVRVKGRFSRRLRDGNWELILER
jgi:hypothetical protein